MHQHIEQWLTKLGDKPIPVLANTIKELSDACKSDNTAISDLVSIVERDPGLTVQLLRTCSQKAHGSLQSDVNSVHQAMMMMGTETIKRLALNLPTLEKTLPPNSQEQLLFTFTRAYHAATQALAWARERRDMTPDEVFAGAQLHFLGEMILSIYAPEKLHEIFEIRMAGHVASEEAQYVTLGFTLDQLSLAIARRWNLPHLVSEALHPENARFPRAYGIMLAVQLTRHATMSWYSRDTMNIINQAADWLGYDTSKVIAHCHGTAAEAARGSLYYARKPAALSLVQPMVKPSAVHNRSNSVDEEEHTGFCLSPQLAVLKTTLHQLNNTGAGEQKEIIKTAMEGLHDGIGLNRVVFTVFNKKNRTLLTHAVIGTENDPGFNRFHVSLKQPHLFVHLMEKMQGVWLNDGNREKLWPMVPREFQKMVKINNFFAMSIFIEDQAIGMVYADRHTTDCRLDRHSYRYFKTLCLQFAKALGNVEHLYFE